MNFRRVYQIFWCKSLTLMKQHRINIMKLGDRLLPISHNQHHITEARNTISPFTHHTKRIASTKSANRKKRLVQDATNLGM